MGEGARILFINWTKHKLVQKYIKSQNMAEWEHNPAKNVPTEIAAFGFNRFYVEYCDSLFKKAIENKGEVVYSFEEIGLEIQLTIHSKPKRHIEVNWHHATYNKSFWLFPLPVIPQGP